MDQQTLMNDLNQGRFSFIDLGCGTGESIVFGEKTFNLGPGIGFELLERKVQIAHDHSRKVIEADVTSTKIPQGCVSFFTMMDFLEHLENYDSSKKILRDVAEIADDFLFIRHPSFERMDYLQSLGFKLDWTDWRGHTNPLTLNDFHRMFEQLGWSDYIIIPKLQILDSSHPAIVPTSAPIDTVRYDSDRHDPKRFINFQHPIWTQFDILIRLNSDMEDHTWQDITSKVSTPHLTNKLRRLYQKEKELRTQAEKAYKKCKQTLTNLKNSVSQP